MRRSGCRGTTCDTLHRLGPLAAFGQPDVHARRTWSLGSAGAAGVCGAQLGTAMQRLQKPPARSIVAWSCWSSAYQVVAADDTTANLTSVRAQA